MCRDQMCLLLPASAAAIKLARILATITLTVTDFSSLQMGRESFVHGQERRHSILLIV
jgi:hypothetical protein